MMHLYLSKARLPKMVKSCLLGALLFSVSQVQAADLKEVYALAAQYDADIQIANADHQAAIQRLPIARSAFLPQVSATLSSGINDVDNDGSGSYNDSAASLSLRQSLFNRTNKAVLDQARAGVSQADSLLAAENQKLILRTTEAYFGVLRAQASQRFSRSELKAIERTREQAERRFDVGLIPVTDVREAQAQYDLATAQKIAADNNLASAREALFLVTGDADLKLSPLTDELPLLAPDPADIEAWVAIALENNPDLVVTRMGAQAAKHAASAERGARYPTLDLVGTALFNTTEQQVLVGNTPTNIDDSSSAKIQLQLNVPLYTGGRVSALVNQASADSASAATGLIAQERRVAQRTRDAYRGVVASISRVNALKQALSSTRKSSKATEAGFEAGTRTSVDVLRALRDTYRAQSDYSSARYDYIINALNLRAAAGTLGESDLEPINNFLVKAK